MYEYVLVLLRHVSRSPISLEHLDLATVEEGLSIGSERDSGYVTRSFALHCRIAATNLPKPPKPMNPCNTS